MRRASLYMRVSTDDQTNRNQEIQLIEVAERRGWIISKIYKDEESGKKRNRPGLNDMLLDAKRGMFDIVLVVKVDRIARSLQDLLEIAGTLGSYNVDLEFTDQDLDITSSQGRLMFQILGAFAEYERELISERTKAGQRRARKQGKKIGRPKLNGMTVKKVLDLKDEGKSYREISKEAGVSIGKVSRIIRESVHKVSIENRGVSPTQIEGVQETAIF